MVLIRALSFLLLVLLALQHGIAYGAFARTSGAQFLIDGRQFYTNGFNAYWLMYTAADPTQIDKVSLAFQQAASYGMTLVRTWAFRDGGYRPLQISPGNYNEDMFKALDFVISEAKKNGVYLILSLVNHWEDFGGRNQYVQWAKSRGQDVSFDDDFYRNELIKQFYKNHIKEWIKEMSAYVKSIDNNHLLEIGMEGFYGESVPKRKQFNPGFEIGTDFIDNHMSLDIDFATIHVYPDQWIPSVDERGQFAFMQSWIQSHVDDAARTLNKPLLVTEFGKSTKLAAASERDNFFSSVYDAIYATGRVSGASGGGLIWQLLADGMDNFRDGYEILISESPNTDSIISQQSHRISRRNSQHLVTEVRDAK